MHTSLGFILDKFTSCFNKLIFEFSFFNVLLVVLFLVFFFPLSSQGNPIVQD